MSVTDLSTNWQLQNDINPMCRQKMRVDLENIHGTNSSATTKLTAPTNFTYLISSK